MKIACSPYSLKGKRTGGERAGALLRVSFPNGRVGYADCHPWPLLGDLPLEKQLQALAKGETTPLTKRSLYYAQVDADARTEGKYLFEGLKIPPSHWQLNDWKEEIPDEFSIVKIKVGRNFEEEFDSLPRFFSSLKRGRKVRLDFNALVSKTHFERYLHLLEPWQEAIDFIEDPCSYDTEVWRSIREKGIAIACDRLSAPCQLRVVKPAVEEVEKIEIPLLFTTYLDHPIGQLAAAYTASSWKGPLLPCGLLSYLNDTQNSYSARLRYRHCCLIPPSEGTGFGFDDLLEKEKWRPLGE